MKMFLGLDQSSYAERETGQTLTVWQHTLLQVLQVPFYYDILSSKAYSPDASLRSLSLSIMRGQSPYLFVPYAQGEVSLALEGLSAEDARSLFQWLLSSRKAPFV